MITVRRIYEPEEPGEQFKVFVDRLWPGGISKEKDYNNARALKEILLNQNNDEI